MLLNKLTHSLRPLLASRLFTTTAAAKMLVHPVPCRSDNYMYIVVDESTNKTAVVDPYDPAKLIAAAKDLDVELGDSLWLTHHHNDHSGGNAKFIDSFPGVKSFAGSTTAPGAQTVLKHKDTFNLGSLNITAIHTPCHTQDHICYYVEDSANNQRAVFTGDTLFISGCGRFFEGTAEEMDVALNQRLAKLPGDTVVYVGHEYTKSNVKFSKSIDPTNERILALEKFADENEVTTGKSTIKDELDWNVFMRLDSEAVKAATKASTPVEAMAALRELKNKG